MKYFETFKEWLYRKRNIQSLPLIATLAEATYVINPKFILVDDYVFLDCGNENLHSYASTEQTDSEKIEIEALENHVHLFEGVKKRFRKDVKKISVSIAKNLSEHLKAKFPNREFVVLLELNYKDSVIVRFHQIRKNEDLYMDPKYFKDEYESGFFMLFR